MLPVSLPDRNKTCSRSSCCFFGSSSDSTARTPAAPFTTPEGLSGCEPSGTDGWQSYLPGVNAFKAEVLFLCFGEGRKHLNAKAPSDFLLGYARRHRKRREQKLAAAAALRSARLCPGGGAETAKAEGARRSPFT